MAQSTQATLGDKLMMIPNLGQTIFAALARLVLSPLSSGAKADKLFKDVAFAALRKNLSLVSVSQEQWLNTKTDSNYLDFTKKQGFQPDTDVLSSGLKVHWLGSKTAEKVLLYFHGGGFVLSCSAGHFQWLFDLEKELSKSHSFSVVLVSYTLAPHGQYPVQVQQAAEALQWLLTQQGRKPSNVSTLQSRSKPEVKKIDRSTDLCWRRLGGREYGFIALFSLTPPASRGGRTYPLERAVGWGDPDLALGQVRSLGRQRQAKRRKRYVSALKHKLPCALPRGQMP
jgi:hypothetical protein